MANEIQFPYEVAGLLTLTATMYKSGNAGAGASPISGISLSDSTSAGVYWGSVPISPAPSAGQYTIAIYNGAILVGSGQLQWDGAKELTGNDLSNAVASQVLGSTVEGSVTLVESLRLSNAVLGGKVSGAGSGVNIFRDLADTKDRVTSTVTTQGNRTNVIKDLT